jgi:hypothetical protein
MAREMDCDLLSYHNVRPCARGSLEMHRHRFYAYGAR